MMKILIQRAFGVALGVGAFAACNTGTEVVGFVANASTGAGGTGTVPSGGGSPSGDTGGVLASAGSAVATTGGGGAGPATAGSTGMATGGTGNSAGAATGGAPATGGSGGATASGPINVLVFNYTTGYGHQSRETAIPLLVQAAMGTDINFDLKYALTVVMPEGPSDPSDSAQPGWKAVDTSAFVPGGLDAYDVVFFLNTTGAPLSADGAAMETVHRQALRDFMEKSHKGFIGTHSATDTYQGNSWPWYVDDLLGANFVNHSNWPTSGSARVNPSTQHPIVTAAGLPDPWQRSEEWYTLSRDVRQYTPADASGVFTTLLLANDNQFPERPTAWVNQMTGGGRVFYSAFGHDVSAFREPNFQKLLFAGIRWAAHRL